MKFEVKSVEILNNIPSASGIVKVEDGYYVVGDDSPFLFSLDQNFREVSRIKIFSEENLAGDRIAKIHKPDFEAMEKINDSEIAIFGSGSKSPKRDYFVRVLLTEEVEVKSQLITNFYNHLKNLHIFRDTELNIEAAAEYNGELFLFNRKKNLIISFNYKNFVAHIEENLAEPEIQIKEVKLPAIKVIEAGFSGATAFPDKPLLIFTASVEDTDNAYDDGEILGSLIGLLDMESGELLHDMLPIHPPDQNEKPLKVESVTIEKVVSENELELILTTDSDGGDSLAIRGTLSL